MNSLEKRRKGILLPVVLFLIGIVLIALSFTFWYSMVSPIVSQNVYSLSENGVSKSISNRSDLLLYFGSVTFKTAPVVNRSRTVDSSFNLSLRIAANTGPISLTIYVRNTPIFNAQTNATVRTIDCNTTRYNNSSYHPTGTLVRPNVYSTVPISLLDAFTGGTTPYMIIENLNSTKPTGITYGYSYNALYRSSNGVPLILFIVGMIIAVVEGITLLRRGIRRVRQR